MVTLLPSLVAVGEECVKTQHVLRRMKHHKRGPQAMFGFLIIIIIIINMKYSIIELPPNPIQSIKAPIAGLWWKVPELWLEV